jgi:hypothetical protein
MQRKLWLQLTIRHNERRFGRGSPYGATQDEWSRYQDWWEDWHTVLQSSKPSGTVQDWQEVAWDQKPKKDGASDHSPSAT